MAHRTLDLGSPTASAESEYAEVGDSALDCFIGCIMEIATKRTEIILRRQLPRLFMTYPDYKLALGFGLHHGWAIEGSLGSQFKVDASYLSPHVHMSDTVRLSARLLVVPMHCCLHWSGLALTSCWLCVDSWRR